MSRGIFKGKLKVGKLTIDVERRRMFIPVVSDRFSQHIWVIDKKEDGSVHSKKDLAVQYVLLKDAPK